MAETAGGTIVNEILIVAVVLILFAAPITVLIHMK